MPISLVGAELIRRAPGLPLTRSTLSTERWSTGGTRSSSASRTAGSWWTPGWLTRRLNTILSTPARRKKGEEEMFVKLSRNVVIYSNQNYLILTTYFSPHSSGPSQALNVTESDAEYPATPWAETSSEYATANTGE